MNSQTHDASLHARARRRVGMKIGFGIHALVFVLVNAGLFAIDAAVGAGRWAHFPLMGWGLGLAIHGIVTAIGLQGDGLRQRMMQSEMQRLRSRS